MSHHPSVPQLEFLFRTKVQVAGPIVIGRLPEGERRIIPITGGSFEGPGIKGEVVPGGADWQLVSEDGTARLEARYSLRTDDGALIYVRNTGLRHGLPEILEAIRRGEAVDPDRYYFRSSPVFETAAPHYEYLNRMVSIGSGMRLANQVIIDFYLVR